MIAPLGGARSELLADLPDGLFGDVSVDQCPAPFAKIFCFAADPNHFLILRCLVPHEGRIAIVTDAG